jgi:hypothetical protein
MAGMAHRNPLILTTTCGRKANEQIGFKMEATPLQTGVCPAMFDKVW